MPDGRVVVATAALVHLAGNAEPYYSLTGEEWRSRRDLTRHRSTGSEAGLYGCGAMHELIVQALPQLAAFARLHLATAEGVPMHAEANGWYWYERSHTTAAEYLRVAPEALPEGLTREQFAEYVAGLAPQWAAEAAEGLAVLQGREGEHHYTACTSPHASCPLCTTEVAG